MPSKRKTRIRGADVFAVVVADRKFSIRAFLVAIVDDADVAAAEDRSLFWVVSYCKLNQVEWEFLLHIETEDETFEGFVSSPLLLGRTPSHRRVTTDDFTKLSLKQHDSAGYPITFFMELLNGKGIFRCSEDEIDL